MSLTKIDENPKMCITKKRRAMSDDQLGFGLDFGCAFVICLVIFYVEKVLWGAVTSRRR